MSAKRAAIGNSVSGLVVGSKISQTTNVYRGDSVLPREWPQAPVSFVDRLEERQVLSDAYGTPDCHVALVEGVPGVGKQALVSRWADQGAEELFSDGVIYIDFSALRRGGAVPLTTVMRDKLGNWVDARAVAARSDSDLQNLYRSVTRDKSMLVFLNDVTSDKEVSYFAPASESSLVVATSTELRPGRHLDELGCKECYVGPLRGDESHRLFEEVMRLRKIEPPQASPALDELLDACAGLPAVITMAAQAYCKAPSEQTLEALSRCPGAALKAGESYLGVMEAAYGRLSPRQRDALGTMVALGLPKLTVQDLSALVGLGASEGEELAQSLGESGFAYVTGRGGVLEVQPLPLVVRLLGNKHNHWLGARSFELAVGRLASFAVDLSVCLDYKLKPKRLRTYSERPVRDSAAARYAASLPAFKVFSRERGFFERIVSLLGGAPTPNLQAWPICEALWSFYNSGHYYDPGLEMLGTAIGQLRAAQNLPGARRGLARMLMLQANFQSKLGRHEGAEKSLQEASQILESMRLGSPSADAGLVDLALSLEEFLGSAASRRGDHKGAFRHFRASLEVAECRLPRSDCERSVVLQSAHAAKELWELGDLAGAEWLYRHALEHTSHVEAHTAQITALRAARLLARRGKWDDVARLAEGCVTYFGEVGEHYQQAQASLLLAEARREGYRDGEALDLARRARDFFAQNHFDEDETAASELVDSLQMGPVRRLARRLLRHLREAGRQGG